MKLSTYLAQEFARRGYVVNTVTIDSTAETITVDTTSGTYVCEIGSDDEQYDFIPVTHPTNRIVCIPFEE